MSTKPEQAISHLVIGTSGHIDHGKSALVRALTGIDPDRLPEEQIRGMTIELGFAHCRLSDEQGAIQLGLVDVPGHEKLVRTMVAGAQGLDLVMLVVAANDGVMPQTREHVDILHLLGVQRGVVVITKCDLVDAETIQLLQLELDELLEKTALRRFPRVEVSSVTGAGLTELQQTLLQLGRQVPPRSLQPHFRLPVDRVFSIHGRGTVVTGTALSGRVTVGDELELWPAGHRVKVRGLHNHNHAQQQLGGGQRVALNLAQVETRAVERGDELATPGYLQPSARLVVRLQLVSGDRRAIRHGQRVRLSIGTAERMTRLVILGKISAHEAGDEIVWGREPIAPGEAGLVQMVAERPLVCEWGQRFIIRQENESATLGGGVVIRPVAGRWRPDDLSEQAGLSALLADPLQRVEEVIRYRQLRREPTRRGVVDLYLMAESGVALAELPAVLMMLEQQGRILPCGGEWLSRRYLVMAAQRSEGWLQRYHLRHPDEPGCLAERFLGWLQRRWGPVITEQVMQDWQKSAQAPARRIGAYWAHADYVPKLSREEERLFAALIAEYQQAGLNSPAVNELLCTKGQPVARLNKLLKLAVAVGELVEYASGAYLAAQVMQEVRARMAEQFRTAGPQTVAHLRDLLNSSRKVMVPLLEYLDKAGFTRRQGDLRVLRESPG
ncbi:MAG: Selenocysteine-specific elongation factor [Phycisphaerae bacterium]|nr:Selenocysteine-specific elongation factor [Phycisphaerae bacterium]